MYHPVTMREQGRAVDIDDVSNLWLAEELHRQGGVRFGDFTLGRSTRHSPIYIDVKVLLRVPQVLRRAAELIVQETQAELGRRRGRFVPFDLVAGVPFGGLHLATAFAIQSDTPMIYAIPHHDGSRERVLEGHYRPGQQVLIVDDLMTTGGSFLETQRGAHGGGPARARRYCAGRPRSGRRRPLAATWDTAGFDPAPAGHAHLLHVAGLHFRGPVSAQYGIRADAPGGLGLRTAPATAQVASGGGGGVSTGPGRNVLAKPGAV